MFVEFVAFVYVISCLGASVSCQPNSRVRVHVASREREKSACTCLIVSTKLISINFIKKKFCVNLELRIKLDEGNKEVTPALVTSGHLLKMALSKYHVLSIEEIEMCLKPKKVVQEDANFMTMEELDVLNTREHLILSQVHAKC